jgi:hypothetical protein
MEVVAKDPNLLWGMGNVAEAVECLLCKHKALSSNLSTSKKKRKEICFWSYS